MKKLYLFLYLLALVACDSDRSKRTNREELRFTTRDDAELFFKNLRRKDYDHQDLKAAKLDIYRHSLRNQQADYPHITPALVINWRYDEAYIVLESNELVGEARPLVIEWQDTVQHLSGQYVLESNNKMEQLNFAAQLYEGLQNRQQFYLVQDSVKLPFLHKAADRKVFRTILMDYYRLTGAI